MGDNQGEHKEGAEMRFRVLARHNDWVHDCTVTESIANENGAVRRFTATILGWQGFRIYEGITCQQLVNDIIAKVRNIRDRIEAGDESVFTENCAVTR
jgi:hypothetical protein